MTQLVKYVLSSAGQRQCQELGEEGLANVSLFLKRETGTLLTRSRMASVLVPRLTTEHQPRGLGSPKMNVSHNGIILWPFQCRINRFRSSHVPSSLTNSRVRIPVPVINPSCIVPLVVTTHIISSSIVYYKLGWMTSKLRLSSLRSSGGRSRINRSLSVHEALKDLVSHPSSPLNQRKDLVSSIQNHERIEY
jgi:hypothetical protein